MKRWYIFLSLLLTLTGCTLAPQIGQRSEILEHMKYATDLEARYGRINQGLVFLDRLEVLDREAVKPFIDLYFTYYHTLLVALGSGDYERSKLLSRLAIQELETLESYIMSTSRKLSKMPMSTERSLNDTAPNIPEALPREF